MPIETNLNSSPYFDDFDEAKEFYKILFKPSVAVQTRELNQLQTILQNQVERFGNHVFKSGTIISGCNFEYLPSYNYIKITDLQGDGQPVQPSSYVGFFIQDSLNLIGRIVNYQDGFESKAPDLSTLYIQYTNSSNADGNGISWSTFRNDQSLTIFDKDYPLFDVLPVSGGLGFSNSDTVVILPAIVVSGNGGSFTVNERLTQATTGAQVQIVAVNTTIVPSKTVIAIKPLTTQLTNNSINSTAWTVSNGFNVTGNVSAAVATVIEIVGSGAQATLVTDSLGIVGGISVTESGNGYYYTPYVTVKTSNTTGSVSTLNLQGQNYKAIVTVANAAVNSVGTGYGFGISTGLIYQKGMFLKVDPQIIIVEKYNNSPNNVVVGFTTVETIIDSNADTSILDNASNTTNFAAPGADRLQLEPTLTILSTSDAEANVDFFALAEWKEGQPWKENRTTAYSQLGAEFARRTFESEGNFVVDPFIVTSKDKATQNVTSYDVVIDPGLAYISGFRIETLHNNYLNADRATTTQTQTNQSFTTNYGNFIYMKELVGLFSFKTGPTVDLYDTAQAYISKYGGANTTITTPTGTKIGTARIRSLILDNGTPGTPQAVYRAYLFEVLMNQGKSFRQVRSVYFNSTTNGIADVVTVLDATSNAQIAQLTDTDFNEIVYSVGQVALQSMSNMTFQYRTVSGPTLQISATGQLDIGPLGAGLTFPYTAGGSLTTTQKGDIVVLPIANAVASANLTGTFAITSASANITGTSTTFLTELKPGDFIKVGNTTSNTVALVATVANNTFLTLSNTVGITVASGNAVKTWPGNYPIRLSDKTVSLSAGGNVLTIQLGTNITGITNAIAIYNVRSANAQPVTKTINRDIYVKIHTANNAGGAVGPWSLGLPDVIRLKNVYLGNSTVVANTNQDITKFFNVDTGADENIYRLGRLVLNPSSNVLSVSLANVFILARIDVMTTGGTEGFFSVGSYSIDDTKPLVNSTSTINTLEIPELLTTRSEYFDLRDSVDFRPYAVNTAAVATTVGAATVNPANTLSLSTNDKFFPVPDAILSFDGTYYVPRVDRVIAKTDGSFQVIQGVPSLTTPPVAPLAPTDTVTLSLLSVKQYPSLPAALSNTTILFLNTRVGNDRGMIMRRNQRFVITNIQSTNTIFEQPRRYTMTDIGRIDRRLKSIEYITALSKLEMEIKDLNIPSSVNPALNRFKHGFFADSFGDYTFAATEQQEFSATIDQAASVLKPRTQQTNYRAGFDRSDSTTNSALISNTTLLLPFTEQTLINQSIITGVVASDGHRVQFIGEIIVDPPTFVIRARNEVTVVVQQPTFGWGADPSWYTTYVTQS